MDEGLREMVGKVAAAAAGSVVAVGGRRRGGAGVIVAPGRIATNAHNVTVPGVHVRTMDGTALDAAVLGVDVDGDLAVLEANVPGPGLSAANGPAVLGQLVMALGIADRGPRVTVGTVAAIGQGFRGPRGVRIAGSIEHTAPMAPGSSGTPLLDADGAWLGLNTHRVGGGSYLAIPADEVLHRRIERLAAGEQIERPRLGVAIAPSWVARRMRAAVGLASREGLLVREVEDGSRAASAGVLVGDLIVAVRGRPVSDPDTLAEAIEASPAGFDLKVVRGDQEMDLVVAEA